ncbi:putative MFS multidrug transporter [Teratosphaeria nubilosa]|uniref:Cercosporin MFS transporter CTB4 n=1 Tax=Teratosphaeria nubilosa TaxID=161662 RepID=A0A6G1L8A5_9PEZI|nr:putative MFS multidrug transporter [Teratosphaeria nubilosa]
MAGSEKDNAVIEAGEASQISTRAHSYADSIHSKGKYETDAKEEAEHGIEEAFGPARDEEEGFHQHGGHHLDLHDPDIVTWDGPDDPENPQNWPLKLKIWISICTGVLTWVVSFGSSVFSATTSVTAEEFGVSEEVMILSVTLYVVGFACGPLVWGPLSEIYGRRTPLMVGMAGFVIFQVPVACATNIQTIFIGRFLSACFGAAPLAIVAGMYVDFWGAVTRGVVTTGYSAAVMAGPTMGPVVGEYTVKNPNMGWRWTAWLVMIVTSFFLIIAIPTVPESLAPIILKQKAARRRFETKNWALHAQIEEEPVTFKALMRKYGLKPLEMIVKEPILVIFTIYISLVYGILYLIFFAFPFSYEMDRGMEVGKASLPFISIFIGVLVAGCYMAWETKVVFLPKYLRSDRPIPEERLPPMMVGSIVLFIGMFWFAWTSFPSINPWPQIIAGAFIGAGIVMVFMPAVVYLVDVYLYDANSALAANAFIRAIVAAAFPLFATYMYQGLGVQWASSLLGFLCVALVPCPFVFYRYGRTIRGWSKFAFDSSE